MPSYTRIWHRPTKTSTPTKTRTLIYIYTHMIAIRPKETTMGSCELFSFQPNFCLSFTELQILQIPRFLGNISSKHATSRFVHQSASPPLSNFVFWSVHLSQQISRFHGFPFGDRSSYLSTSHWKNHPFTSHLPEKKGRTKRGFWSTISLPRSHAWGIGVIPNASLSLKTHCITSSQINGKLWYPDLISKATFKPMMYPTKRIEHTWTYTFNELHCKFGQNFLDLPFRNSRKSTEIFIENHQDSSACSSGKISQSNSTIPPLSPGHSD